MKTEITTFHDKTLSELEGIYTATFGVFPPKGKIRLDFIVIFEQEVEFGRKLYQFDQPFEVAERPDWNPKD